MAVSGYTIYYCLPGINLIINWILLVPGTLLALQYDVCFRVSCVGRTVHRG